MVLESSPRGPSELLSPNDVNVEVVDGLAAVLAVVHHETATIAVQALLARHLGGHKHEVTQDRLVLRGRLGEPRQARPLLWDHKQVHGPLGQNIAEGQGLVVLVNLCARDFTGDDLVEDRRGSLLFRSGLSLVNLTHGTRAANDRTANTKDGSLSKWIEPTSCERTVLGAKDDTRGDSMEGWNESP